MYDTPRNEVSGLKINEVEALVGITKKNIRFYEAEGLLTPRRNSENGYRDYGEAEVETLRRIKLLRKLGFPLEEIRQMQTGSRTVGDGMRRHLVTLEREQENLRSAAQLCAGLTDCAEKLDTLDARSLLERMEQMEQEGTTFMDKQKLDMKRRYAAPVVAAVVMAVLVYILLEKTTFGYELKACGANRHAARYAGIRDKRNIVCSMAIAGAMAGAAGALYYLSGNTEFFWSTYQALPSEGFDGIAVALLAVNNPIGVVFTGIFMSLLSIAGLQLTNLTAYNEYITDVIIAVIVYLSAFSLVIKLWISGRKAAGKPPLFARKKPDGAGITPAATEAAAAPAAPEETGKEAQE